MTPPPLQLGRVWTYNICEFLCQKRKIFHQRFGLKRGCKICIEISQPLPCSRNLIYSYQLWIFCTEGRRDSFDYRRQASSFLVKRLVEHLLTEKKERRTCFLFNCSFPSNVQCSEVFTTWWRLTDRLMIYSQKENKTLDKKCQITSWSLQQLQGPEQ